MPSHTISIKVSEQLKSRIERFQEDGETRSAAVRRLIRRGLTDSPGDGAYVTVITFSIAWAAAVYLSNDYTVLLLESGVFHLLAILWVSFPPLRKFSYNLRNLQE